MKKLIFLIIALALITPIGAIEAATIEVAGWIPYWEIKAGTRSARRHIELVDTLHPFTYSVKKDGSLNDLGNMKQSAWKNLIKKARKEKVEIIPTVMWSDTENMYRILSNPDAREEHVEAIANMVKKGKYDGIDIDYEGKSAATKDHFSLFLTELKKEIGNKMLVCTIEARTPPESLYTVVPATINYANDYAVIGRVCDRVQIMTYDQQRADIKLNQARMGSPYIPVGDAEWVEKVMIYTMKFIPKEKLMIGIATYGREWEVKVSPQRYEAYIQARSINRKDVEAISKEYKIKPERNSAGELSLSYTPKGSAFSVAGYPGKTVAEQALSYANATGRTTYFNLLWWSDAEAAIDKIELAEKLGVRGVVIFKIDGGEDDGIWEYLEEEIK